MAAVSLGTAGDYGVLAGTTVTSTGNTVINGDVGVAPGTSITGFPVPGTASGSIHAGDAAAAQAQLDLTSAFNNLAGRSSSTMGLSGLDLGGQTLVSGVFNDPGSLFLTGTLKLDAMGNPNAIFIIQVGSTFTTAADSQVDLINGAQADNVFFEVGSSATLGARSDLNGNVLALTSITADTGATIDGRLLARNGAVTLDDDTILDPDVATGTPGSVPESGSTLGMALIGFGGVFFLKNHIKAGSKI
jgi:hypothetical protein